MSIAYSEHIIPEDQRINLSVINEKLGVVLGSVLNPAGLDYRLVGNQIVIVKGLQQFQNELFTIYGYVKDAMSNESLIGANVYLPDKSSGTSTNQAGFYSFKIKGGHQRIYFSYLGYKTAVADFQLYKDTVIHVRLKADGKLK
ncbi:MAG: carboxypeptidase-like regulatory domain-containing protein [Saprospiraceae bacterium]|nr:carboxypeptidase-like regulatory domain-containing protein [Saprospiraceae bacterium]